MHTLFSLAAAGLVALSLCACDKVPTGPPAPKIEPVQAEPGAVVQSSSDPSVPSADSVFAPAPDIRLDPAAGRSSRPMSNAQESTAMPLPGQNNDHSAPLAPAKRASGV